MENLYEIPVNQSLLEYSFTFYRQEDIGKFYFNSVPYDSLIGYILEVDLEYDDSLHGYYKDYPLAPENTTITKDDLSSYMLDWADKLDVELKPGQKQICNLKPKSITLYITGT